MCLAFIISYNLSKFGSVLNTPDNDNLNRAYQFDTLCEPIISFCFSLLNYCNSTVTH